MNDSGMQVKVSQHLKKYFSLKNSYEEVGISKSKKKKANVERLSRAVCMCYCLDINDAKSCFSTLTSGGTYYNLHT